MRHNHIVKAIVRKRFAFKPIVVFLGWESLPFGRQCAPRALNTDGSAGGSAVGQRTSARRLQPLVRHCRLSDGCSAADPVSRIETILLEAQNVDLLLRSGLRCINA